MEPKNKQNETKALSSLMREAQRQCPTFLEDTADLRNDNDHQKSGSEWASTALARCRASLPPRKDQPRVSIFGSVEFYHTDSPALCEQIGKTLAQRIPRACILTGANAVTQEHLSRAFLDEAVSRNNNKSNSQDTSKTTTAKAHVYHLAPAGFSCEWGFGCCLEAGRDMKERRRILATLADVCISIEGGPGTADEMSIALNAGNVVIPLARTGGASSGMFEAPIPPRPPFIDESLWSCLFDTTASIVASAEAVVSIVEAALQVARMRGIDKEGKIQRQQQAMQHVIADTLNMDVSYAKRPNLPEGLPAYVEPTLCSCAHLVFRGTDDLQNRENRAVTMGDIYLGPQMAAMERCKNQLLEAGIGGIVNCTPNFPCNFVGDLQYCTVSVNDEIGADILVFLDGATTFLHALLTKGQNVLVHCQMGVSRSSTVVMAYLIRFWNMTRDEAFLHVKSRRPRANPNAGFWNQLLQFEKRYARTTNFATTNDKDENGQSRVVFDIGWAKRSNALYATCHEAPEVLRNSDLLRCLPECVDQEQVLSVCLDYIWGRGVLVIDLEWLKYVCHILDQQERNDPESEIQSAISTVKKILKNKDSDFWGVWVGEIYDSQIQKVLQTLSS